MTIGASLKEQLNALSQVQEIDLKIDQIKKQKGGLPEELKILDQKLMALSRDGDAKNAELLEIEKQHRQVKAAMDLNRDRMERAKKKMEGVTDTVQMNAAQKEIDQLTKMNTQLDGDLAKAQTRVEQVTADLQKIQSAQDEVQKSRDEKAVAILEQQGNLEGGLSELQRKRTEIAKNVPPTLMTQYERVRSRREGIGIAHSTSGRCGACHMSLAPQIKNLMSRGDQVVNCANCSRILYEA